ncbi:hypothetical protein EJ07DRAFT_177758 [Lizonia empirigonia]|nr:hypothetical protein EJ07DRAFT_177758 [Lizonia empirigonia]
MSLASKHSTITALRQHRINTLTSLRHTERALATLDTPDVSAPMTAAWTYYVSSNQLLTELRGLMRTHAFSAACVDEARSRVYADPESNRSWNLAWLVLRKIGNDRLIAYFARLQAARPETWKGRVSGEEKVGRLADEIVLEWEGAVGQMLRCWETPPTR